MFDYDYEVTWNFPLVISLFLSFIYWVLYIWTGLWEDHLRRNGISHLLLSGKQADRDNSSFHTLTISLSWGLYSDGKHLPSTGTLFTILDSCESVSSIPISWRTFAASWISTSFPTDKNGNTWHFTEPFNYYRMTMTSSTQFIIELG